MTKVQSRLKFALTVEGFIQILSGMNPEARVAFVCDYGDHCHTQQVLPVQEIETLHESDIKETAYSASALGLTREEPEENEGDEVIILR